MSHLRYVTLTGVDEHTDLNRLVALSEQYPFVEWAVLYSESRAGVETRYPSLSWIERFAVLANEHNLNISLHLCGGVVGRLRKLFEPGQSPRNAPQPLAAMLSLMASFGRVQLNTTVDMDDLRSLSEMASYIVRSENRTRVVLQWHERNGPACSRLGNEDPFEFLVDSSGGRGVERTEWPSLGHVHPRAGYAGGLGPANLAAQLPLIAKAAQTRAFWVDMESKVRDSLDRFDLDACAQVLAIAEEFDNASRFADGAQYGDQSVLVRDLDGLWLDWWVGYVLGYDLVVPPLDACRATYLYRPTGRFESFSPSENQGQAVRLFHSEKIALTPLPTDGLASEDEDEDDEAATSIATWEAHALGAEDLLMPGTSLVQAGLRAIVAKYVGLSVPANPMAYLAD